MVSPKIEARVDQILMNCYHLLQQYSIASFNEDTWEDYISVPSDCTVEHGATKLVIIPDDDNFVIKIPFQYSTDIYDEDDEELYYPFENAVYYMDGESGGDYCRAEAQYYDAASIVGLGRFFARTVYVKNIGEFPIYIQEKCESIYWESQSSHSHSREEQDSAHRYISSVGVSVALDTDFVIDLINTYGQESTTAFLKFIDEMDIEDLHSSNYGYCGGRPVLIDYSSFNS